MQLPPHVFHGLQCELAEQRALVQQLVSKELPAMRMEIAILRAELQSFEDRFTPGLHQAEAGSANGYDLLPKAALQDTLVEGSVEVLGCHEEDTALLLQASVWDCAAVVLLEGREAAEALVGPFNVALTWVLLFINIFVQVIFSVAVYSLVVLDPFADTLAAMRNRRLVQGQDYRNMDYWTVMTQTQQMCQSGSYNRLESTIDILKTYLDLDMDTMVQGSTICLMAMLIWILDIMRELRSAVNLLLAVHWLPVTQEPRLTRQADGSCFILEGVPRGQKILCVTLVLIPRIAIALFLTWFGMRFLAGTIDTGELILNAVALEIVNSTDEMFFAAIVPRRLMKHVENARIRLLQATQTGRIRARGSSKTGGMSVQSFYSLGRLLLLCSLLLVSYSVHILPVVKSSKKVYDSVCGHDTNFTYMYHPVTLLPVFAHVDPFAANNNEGVNELRCFYAARYELLMIRAGFKPVYSDHNDTLAQLVNGSHPSCQAGPFEETPLECTERREGLRYFANLGVTWSSQYYESYDCRDQDVAFYVLRQTCMADEFVQGSGGATSFFRDITQCSDLKHRCRENLLKHNMSLTWFWQLQRVCPKTCGKCRTRHHHHGHHGHNGGAAAPQDPLTMEIPEDAPASGDMGAASESLTYVRFGHFGKEGSALNKSKPIAPSAPPGALVALAAPAR